MTQPSEVTDPLRRELMPCPFCGEKPEALHFAEGSTFRWLDVSCPSCGASPGEVRVQTLGEGTKEQWRVKAEADAIDAWNTRAPSPEPAAARKAEREKWKAELFELENAARVFSNLALDGDGAALAGIRDFHRAIDKAAAIRALED